MRRTFVCEKWMYVQSENSDRNHAHIHNTLTQTYNTINVHVYQFVAKMLGKYF